ncbi:MAG: hypothetical protein IJV76_01600, partial [Clostridia bacterium]|nr:hypothetical protein [Clostridia bacterium]
MNEQIKTIEPYGATFYENRERPLNVRMAMASRETAKHCSVWIDEKNYLGYTTSGWETYGMSYRFYSGVDVNEGKFRENAEKFPEFAEELDEIREYVKDYNTLSQGWAHKDQYQKELAFTMACWGATGSDIPIRTMTACCISVRKESVK